MKNVLLFFLWSLVLNLSAQVQDIQYFSSEDSSYLIFDLYANVGGRVYNLIDSLDGDCYTIVDQKDYNEDGQLDILMGHVIGCGGNCCANAYFVFYIEDGMFKKTADVGNGDYILSEKEEHNWTILLRNNIQNPKNGHRYWVQERYSLQEDSLVRIARYKGAKINASADDDYSSKTKTVDSIYLVTDNYLIHKVEKEGQNLWALANKYKTSVVAIKALNNKTEDAVYLGEQLKIPQVNSHLFHLHYIKSEETLWKISQQYNVPVAFIKQVNQLENNEIRIGETLKIPQKKVGTK